MNMMSAIKNLINNGHADPFTQIDFWGHSQAGQNPKRDLKRQEISMAELGLDEII